MVVLGGAKIKHYKNCNVLPNLLKLIQFGMILQKDELHQIFEYFLLGLISYN